MWTSDKQAGLEFEAPLTEAELWMRSTRRNSRSSGIPSTTGLSTTGRSNARTDAPAHRPHSANLFVHPRIKAALCGASLVCAVMETRQIIAYVLIALLLASLTAVWRYLTRERRAHYRSHRQGQRRKLAREPSA